MIVYKNLEFPSPVNRSYFFSNFVQTIDGRTVIKNTAAYEPIGSSTDFETFLDLRKYADALIHGKHTASTHRTVETIAQQHFLQKRKKQGKKEVLPYLIITNHPDNSLTPALINNPMEKPYLITHEQANIPASIENLVFVLRVGKNEVDLKKLPFVLFQKGYNHVLVEGGPTLMGSFFSKNLIDEIFITIAPKIFSGISHQFLTLTDGPLLPVENIHHWNLISTKVVDNELFLRYQKSSLQ